MASLFGVATRKWSDCLTFSWRFGFRGDSGRVDYTEPDNHLRIFDFSGILVAWFLIQLL
jgi:hypothetical protein